MKKSIVVGFIVILLIVLPYLFAAVSTQGNPIFGGFLLNPKDGNSYLAKMYEGYQGEWLFTLPFNVEKGNGHLLFTFYLFLGHLAKWFHLPIIWMFHIARIGSAGFLLWAISKFSICLFPDSKAKADLFFLIYRTWFWNGVVIIFLWNYDFRSLGGRGLSIFIDVYQSTFPVRPGINALVAD